MTGKPEIVSLTLDRETSSIKLLSEGETGEEAAVFLERHFALLDNHFTPRFIREYPWLSATEIQARWNQRQIEIDNVSSVGRRIRRIVDALSKEFPQIPRSVWINEKERTQRFSPLAVAVTETYEGPWPTAFPCLPLSEWAEITGTEEPFLEQHFREARDPTFCLSDFFHTTYGLYASFPLARRVLTPLGMTIGQINAEAAKRETKHITDLKEPLAPLTYDFKDLLESLNPGSRWWSLVKQVKSVIGPLSEAELMLLLNLHQHRIEGERALVGLSFYKGPEKNLVKADLEEALKFTHLVDFCLVLCFLLPKALRIADEYYGQFLPLSEDLIGECLLAAINFMDSTAELNLERLIGEMRNRIVRNCVSAGKGIGWRVYEHIGTIENARETLQKTGKDANNVELIAGFSGLNPEQVETALEAFGLQVDLSLDLLTRKEEKKLALRDKPLEELVEESIFREILFDVLDSLPETDKRILGALFIQGKSLEELATEMGWQSKSSASRARDRVLEKIRQDPRLRDWFI